MFVSGKVSRRKSTLLLASLLAGASLLGAADEAVTAVASPATVAAGSQSKNDELAQLKASLAEQQKQLQLLQQTIQSQQALLEKVLASKTASGNPGASSGTFTGIGQVASTTPIMPVAPLPAVAYPSPAIAAPLPQASTSGSSGNPCEAAAAGSGDVPPYLRLGSVCIIPVGFMDLTPIWRDKNTGSSIASSFGSVPYNNVANGNLSEFHFTAQDSRLGFRIDGDWKGTHFIAFNEFDFAGTSGATNLAVTNGAIVPRLRLFWIDARKDKWEFLAGQSWSMLTPNRAGISALPADLFFSQTIDISYVAGLTWTRQPGMRVLYHPNKQVTFAFAGEQPDQYMGGSGGGGGITLPAAYTALTSTQLDNGANISGASYLSQPTVTPDFIAKVAFDPSSRFHFEVAGIERNFKTVNPALLTQHFTTTGEGLQFGLNAEVVKGLRLISTNFLGDGGGRYLFGQAPDLIVRANGSLSPVKADGTVDGVEAVIKNTLLYGYYGGIFIDRNTALDANGTTKIGYGYTGSPNSQNRAINEITFGFNQTMWRNPRYGAINLMGQYYWVERDPWFVAVGAPKATHDNTIFMNVRYSLPGSMPNF